MSDRHLPVVQRALCQECLTPYTPGTHFCPKCGAPLSSFATIAPWERIQAERHIFANAASDPRKPITLIGVWLIFGAMLASGLALTIMCFPLQLRNLGVESALIALTGVFLAFIGGFVIVRTTINYLKKKRHAIDTEPGE